MTERFMKYLRFNTQSDANAATTPSTGGQREFAGYLAEELRSIGMSDVCVDENAYLTASLPANVEGENIPVIGLIAHLDTTPEMTGENVKPRVVKNYDGGNIILNKEDNIILSPQDFPELKQYAGQDIIVTDGRTLLGADNKAGIAEIVSAMEYLLQHPGIRHGHIRVAFTPDEEIGHGARLLDIERFGADWAYTVDGGATGEIEFENFNAAQAVVTFRGRNLHPGYAKGKMQNSLLRANEFIAALPKNETPVETEGYEGFFHLLSVNGTVEETTLVCIVRDHDARHFEERTNLLRKLAGKYGATIEMTDQYRNMREQIEPVYHIVERAVNAMKRAGVEPVIKPVRGGTDGAQLSFRGLPCPNIFTGGHNFHGKFEFIPVQSMEKAVATVVNLLVIESPDCFVPVGKARDHSEKYCRQN